MFKIETPSTQIPSFLSNPRNRHSLGIMHPVQAKPLVALRQIAEQYERFTPNTKEATPSHAYIPFSTGHRHYIGKRFALLKTRLVLAMIAPHFTLRTTALQIVEAVAGATLASKTPIQITIHSA